MFIVENYFTHTRQNTCSIAIITDSTSPPTVPPLNMLLQSSLL